MFIMQEKTTNWTEYYTHPFFMSYLTRKFTAKKAVKMLKKHFNGNDIQKNKSLLELGGGGSTFFPFFSKKLNLIQYTALDKNEKGLEVFLEHAKYETSAKGILCDFLSNSVPDEKYDIVCSFGLIEHFSPKDREKILRLHFQLTNPKGYTLISFPTNIFPYHFFRKTAELCHLWKFHDEIPLEYHDVTQTCLQYGNILDISINYFTIFTQAMILLQKK